MSVNSRVRTDSVTPATVGELRLPTDRRGCHILTVSTTVRPTPTHRPLARAPMRGARSQTLEGRLVELSTSLADRGASGAGQIEGGERRADDRAVVADGAMCVRRDAFTPPGSW